MARHEAAKGTTAMPGAGIVLRNQGGSRGTENMIALPEVKVQYPYSQFFYQRGNRCDFLELPLLCW
jgi:hypothetical protein